MRPRRPLGATYGGIIAGGVIGGAAFALLSAVMFLFRSVCEPLVRIAVSFVAIYLHAYLRYEPAQYWYVAGFVGALGALVVFVAIIALIRRPGDDRRMDAALLRETSEFVNGAPLERR
jgi:hypothetical protein